MELVSKSDSLVIQTRGSQYLDITADINNLLDKSGIKEGLITLFIKHTSASLCIQENADPDVILDLKNALDRLAPEGSHYRHHMEGPDDMPAHIKSAITPVNLMIPVQNGRLMLGTWQGIYVLEHRSMPHRREIAINVTGTKH